MMKRDTEIDLLDRLHSAQDRVLGRVAPAMPSSSFSIGRHLDSPGESRCRDIPGPEAVFGYFRRRRHLADRTFQTRRSRAEVTVTLSR